MNISVGWRTLTDDQSTCKYVCAGVVRGWCATVQAIASIGTGLCSTLPQLLLCRLLLGAGSSSALAGSGAYMAVITPHRDPSSGTFSELCARYAYACCFGGIGAIQDTPSLHRLLRIGLPFTYFRCLLPSGHYDALS